MPARPAAADIYLLRAIDSFSLTLATATVALKLAQQQGVGAYSFFMSLVVLGTALGGLLTFAMLNARRRRVFSMVGAAVSGAGRVLLVVAVAGAAGEHLTWLGTGGLVVAAASVGLLAMVHSLVSRDGGDLKARTTLIAATATGGVLGTAAAGGVVEMNLWIPLVAVQLGGAVAGVAVALHYVRAFPQAPDPLPSARRWPTFPRTFGPIAWRVPVIAGASFSIGSLAPGVVTDGGSAALGALVGSMYMLGAVGTTALIRLWDRPPRRALSFWLADHRRWFLPAALGAALWWTLPGPPLVSLVGAVLAGIVLHLVQAGYEQATAAMDSAEHAGPYIVVLQSAAGAAAALSLTVLPRIMSHIGYAGLVGLLVAILMVLAVMDRRQRRAGLQQASLSD